MRKLLLLFTELVALLTINFAMVSGASAVDIFPTCPSSGGPNICKDVKSSPAQDPVIVAIKAVMEIIAFIAGAAAVILIIVSAIRFITSGGDSNAVSAAKGTLVNALIGIAIVVLAQAIVVFVLDNIK